MSQTNINTRSGNINRNQHARKCGQGQGCSGGRGPGSCGGDRGNSTTAKSSFEGKMKGGCLHKLTITECTHQATQYKKLIDALPVLCTDKGFRFVNDIICTDRELVKASFLPSYPAKHYD